MRKLLKAIYKSLVALLLGLMSLLLATGIYIYYYQEQIIAKSFQAITSQLAYPIKAKSVTLNLFRDFPKVSLLLEDIIIQDTHQVPKNILTANRVDCVFNIWDILNGQYTLHEVCIAQGALSFYSKDIQNKYQQVAYTDSVYAGKIVDKEKHNIFYLINLKKLVLKDISCVYITGSKYQQYKIYAHHVLANCNISLQGPSIQLEGKTTVQQLGPLTIKSKSDIPIYIKANINYDTLKQLYTIKQGVVNYDESNIQVYGSWSNSSTKSFVNLHANINQLTFTNLTSWLPDSYSHKLDTYKLQGRLLGKVHLTKQAKASIGINADFKLDNGSLLPKTLIHPIQIEQLSGNVDIPDIHNLNHSFLQIDGYKAKLGDSYFTGNIKITDLSKLYLQSYTNMIIDLPTLSQAIYNSTNRYLQGQLIGDLNFEGSLENLLSGNCKHGLSNYKGRLISNNVQFAYNKAIFHIQDSSTVLLQDNTINFQDISGQIDSKPFVLQGKLSNWMRSKYNEQEDLYLEAKLYAEYLALDKLLLVDNSHATSIKGICIPPYLKGELLCDIEEVVYKRFFGNGLRGKLKLHNQELILDHLECRFAGGTSRLTSTIDINPDNLLIHTHANLQDVQLGTLFYTFENFNQDFLKDKHLGGHICSNIDLSMKADKDFNIDVSSILANLSIQLDKGILQNFEPLQQLAPYVSEKDLKYLHFSSLKNNILIKDKIIYIPTMEVHTSVTSIQLSGMHTFDGKLCYNLVVPLQHYNSKDIGQYIPEINRDALAGLNLYLKLEGDIHNYNLRYDSSLFKENLKENIKKQGSILEKILQGKALPKHTKELSKEEYFDFNE